MRRRDPAPEPPGMDSRRVLGDGAHCLPPKPKPKPKPTFLRLTLISRSSAGQRAGPCAGGIRRPSPQGWVHGVSWAMARTASYPSHPKPKPTFLRLTLISRSSAGQRAGPCAGGTRRPSPQGWVHGVSWAMARAASYPIPSHPIPSHPIPSQTQTQTNFSTPHSN